MDSICRFVAVVVVDDDKKNRSYLRFVGAAGSFRLPAVFLQYFYGVFVASLDSFECKRCFFCVGISGTWLIFSGIVRHIGNPDAFLVDATFFGFSFS